MKRLYYWKWRLALMGAVLLFPALMPVLLPDAVGRPVLPAHDAHLTSRLDAVQADWQRPQRMHLGGVAIEFAEFSAAQSLPDMARAFAQANPAFQQMLVMPERIVLSGIDDGHHWLAEIEMAGAGVQGRMSALALHARNAAPGIVLPGPAPLLSATLDSRSGAATLALHARGAPAPATVAASLRQAGWQRGSPDVRRSAQAPVQWHHSDHRLTVLSGDDTGIPFLITALSREP